MNKRFCRKASLILMFGFLLPIALFAQTDSTFSNGVIPVMINAYGKGDQKIFLIEGSEVPGSVPGWVWIGHILFGGWAIYYLITQLFSH